jgi:hypothetical protein
MDASPDLPSAGVNRFRFYGSVHHAHLSHWPPEVSQEVGGAWAGCKPNPLEANRPAR